MNNAGQWQEELELLEAEQTTEQHHIVVWNDDVNTFEWVIVCLMEICDHTEEQAEQCAYIIHFSGKYAVKKGTYHALKPMCEALQDRGLNATIA